MSLFDREDVQTRLALRRTLKDLDGRTSRRRLAMDVGAILAIALMLAGAALWIFRR